MQPIVPFLWYENQAEEAIAHYVAAFKHARLLALHRFPDVPMESPAPWLEGKVMTGDFELAGQRIMAFDGGPYFKLNPAVSFFVECETEAEMDRLWAWLVEGGLVLMEAGKYPFSEKFGWLQDRFGLSWQISLTGRPQTVTPFLMFAGSQNGRAEEAIQFYTSLFEDSGIAHIQRFEAGGMGEVGKVQLASFTLRGQSFMAIDGGPHHDFTFSEATSLYVECATQEEIDQLWEKLSADPSAEQCGWLKDKFGVSWQIVPAVFYELANDPDPVRVKRVMDATLQMKKLEIAGLMRAYEG